MSQTELMIAWDAQADATTYDIEHRTGSGNWITTTATTTPAMLTGLTASTEYEIRVRAKNATEIGDWSSTITQTTLDPPPPPDPDPALAQVTGVSVTTTMSQTELMIAWDAQVDATTYDIEHRAGTNAWITTSATTTPALLTGLTASTEYEIRVRAKNTTETGEWSSTATQTTPDNPVSPPQQTLTQVTGVSATTTTEDTELSVSFTTQTTATGYDVEYRLTSSAPSGLWTCLLYTSPSPRD